MELDFKRVHPGEGRCLKCKVTLPCDCLSDEAVLWEDVLGQPCGTETVHFPLGSSSGPGTCLAEYRGEWVAPLKVRGSPSWSCHLPPRPDVLGPTFQCLA